MLPVSLKNGQSKASDTKEKKSWETESIYRSPKVSRSYQGAKASAML